MKNYRLVIGILFWCIVCAAGALVPVVLSENSWISAFGKIYRHLNSERQIVKVKFDRDLWVVIGDPVYLKTEYGLKRIGQVISEQLDDEGFMDRSQTVTIAFYGDAPPVTKNCFVTLHETPGSFEWAFNEMLPPEKRAEIIEDLKAEFEIHQAEILEGFMPIIRDAVVEMGWVLQEDLRNAIKDNREKLASIGARYQESFVEKRLIPLIRKEIWPIVEKRSRPILDEVGSEIWKKASLWRFGWRLAYDKFPLTNSNLVQQEWNRFVKNDAMPVIEGHADDFYQLARTVMREIAENEEVKSAGREGLQQLLADEEIKELISDTLWKILFENERLNEVIQRNLSNEKTINMIRDTSQKFEDKIRQIGDDIFGTFERGITDNFAKVLRKEILRRDERWFRLRYSSSSEDDRLELADEVEGYFLQDSDDRPELDFGNDR